MGQCDGLGRPHHPLESPAVAGGADAVPSGETAQQDVFNCALVNVCEGFRGQAKFLEPPEFVFRVHSEYLFSTGCVFISL